VGWTYRFEAYAGRQTKLGYYYPADALGRPRRGPNLTVANGTLVSKVDYVRGSLTTGLSKRSSRPNCRMRHFLAWRAEALDDRLRHRTLASDAIRTLAMGPPSASWP
jgi:hypothetical protein